MFLASKYIKNSSIFMKMSFFSGKFNWNIDISVNFQVFCGFWAYFDKILVQVTSKVILPHILNVIKGIKTKNKHKLLQKSLIFVKKLTRFWKNFDIFPFLKVYTPVYAPGTPLGSCIMSRQKFWCIACSEKTRKTMKNSNFMPKNEV